MNKFCFGFKKTDPKVPTIMAKNSLDSENTTNYEINKENKDSDCQTALNVTRLQQFSTKVDETNHHHLCKLGWICLEKNGVRPIYRMREFSSQSPTHYDIQFLSHK